MAAVVQQAGWMLCFTHPSNKWAHFKVSAVLRVSVLQQALSWSWVQFRSPVWYIWELQRHFVLPWIFCWEQNSTLCVQMLLGHSLKTPFALCMHNIFMSIWYKKVLFMSFFFVLISSNEWQYNLVQKKVQPWVEHVYLAVSANQVKHKTPQNPEAGWSIRSRYCLKWHDMVKT